MLETISENPLFFVLSSTVILAGIALIIPMYSSHRRFTKSIHGNRQAIDELVDSL